MATSPTLLISLGTSWAVVPEAFLLPDADFCEVHILTTVGKTTEKAISEVIEWFAAHNPYTQLSITRVDGFADLLTERDHFIFEEVLCRWVLECAPEPATRFICVAGGFKTMSAAMQKAAAVLGAAEVFHVLCAGNPASAEQIETARACGRIHWIRLGREDGWPQFRNASATQFPLETVSGTGFTRVVRSPDDAFRQYLAEIVQRAHNIAGAWSDLTELPFHVLATWSGSEINWLKEPLDPEADADWVRALPKIELHTHLGGFATHGDLLSQVRAAAGISNDLRLTDEPSRPPGWPWPLEPIGLAAYMRLGDATGSAALHDPACLRRQCELLYAHLFTEGIRYAEIRCSPANYARPGRSPWTVLETIKQTFDGCMEAARKRDAAAFCHVNLLIIATRREKGDFRSGIARHLALAVSAAEHWMNEDECRVVGVDLAGYEDPKTRAHFFHEEFTAVHRCGLALTVHAGENDDAEAIWSAVFDLNARRLGHALHLADSPDLLRSIADRGIAVEMCPFANCQVLGFAPMPSGEAGISRPSYPIVDYLREGVRATINTDNIGISAASLSENILVLPTLCPEITRLDILWLQRHALDAAFLSPKARAALRRRIEEAVPHPASLTNFAPTTQSHHSPGFNQ